MRDQINAELKQAMKAADKRRVETIRMMLAALKNKDIENRGEGKEVTEDEVLGVLQKMVKSRQESLEIYEKAGRTDLARQESEEIAVIRSFLPQPLSEAETSAAIEAAVAETGASGMKDMGKVIALLRSRHAGRMDFSKASGLVKAKLA